MTFSSIVTGHWLPYGVGEPRPDQVYVVVVGSLQRSVSLVQIDRGPAVLSVTPERAEQLGLADRHWVNSDLVRHRLREGTITLNDPDNLFYLPLDRPAGLSGAGPHTRRLTELDAPAFAELAAQAPADDLDEAYVELDHWLVFGTFDGDALVAAASMYPWAGSRLADLGVITLPAFRGRGLGRRTVQAISAAARERGYEPQYRCQLDNIGSVALAISAGFVRFGQWEVIIDG